MASESKSTNVLGGGAPAVPCVRSSPSLSSQIGKSPLLSPRLACPTPAPSPAFLPSGQLPNPPSLSVDEVRFRLDGNRSSAPSAMVPNYSTELLQMETVPETETIPKDLPKSDRTSKNNL